MIRVALIGYKGKLGHLAHKWIDTSEIAKVSLVIGRDDPFPNDLYNQVDCALELSTAKSVFTNTEKLIQAGIPCIVGASGIDKDQYQHIDLLAKENNTSAWIIPNFSLGAIFLNQCAKRLAKSFSEAHIIEAHHPQKLDAPSGTSQMLAQSIEETGHYQPPISSIRLSGIIADQTVLFGSPGETLEIRHHTSDRNAFKKGILLAISEICRQKKGLTVGMDHLLSL